MVVGAIDADLYGQCSEFLVFQAADADGSTLDMTMTAKSTLPTRIVLRWARFL